MRIILILSALALVLLVLGFGIHGVKGLDDLIEKIGSQISRDVRDFTGALSDAIAGVETGPFPASEGRPPLAAFRRGCCGSRGRACPQGCG
jgi:hypothetical protein